MEMLNTWQFNLVGYLICVVGFYQFYRLAVRNAKVDGAATILLQFLGGISALVLTPFFAIKFPTEAKYWWFILGACVFYALYDRLQTTVRKHLQVSVVTIIGQLSTVFLLIYGILFFREPFHVNKFLGVLLILIANILIRYSKGKFDFNKYVVIAIVSTLAFVTAISIDIGISAQFNLPIYIMLTLIVPASFIMIGEKIKFREVFEEFKTKDKKYYILTGIAWALTIFFSLRTFQLGSVTTIVPLQASSVLLNVLVAHFVMGEKKDGVKKIISAILVILGIYLTILR